MYRIGHGIDVHQFCEGRPLVLGGIAIPHPKGLSGHSDADVVIHAVCDALLGAVGMPDIGHWFPSSDEQYRGISSMILLDRVVEMLHRDDWRVGNIDVTVLAQAPLLKPYHEKIRERLARHLGIEPLAVGFKATTTESLGFVGRQEGIEAHAVCLVAKAQ